MNVVLMCRGSNPGKVAEILTALEQVNLPVRAVLAQRDVRQPIQWLALWHRWREKRAASRYFHTTQKSLPAANGKDLSRLHFTEEEQRWVSALSHAVAEKGIEEICQSRGIACARVDNLNGPQAVSLLQEWQTDLLIFGGVPIIRRPVLEVPKLGTLNVHMGLLPYFRGKHVAEWAVYLDGPVGVSVHLVDPGVDTGAILCRYPIDVSDCRQIRQMRRKMSLIQHGVLARTAKDFVEGNLEPIPQTREQGRQFYAMHPRLRQVVEEKLHRGYRPRFSLEDFVEQLQIGSLPS